MVDRKKIEVDALIEIVYDLYLKDLKAGKLKEEVLKQPVGKSADQKSLTFHQVAFDYR
jgi:hypothetical protein